MIFVKISTKTRNFGIKTIKEVFKGFMGKFTNEMSEPS